MSFFSTARSAAGPTATLFVAASFVGVLFSGVTALANPTIFRSPNGVTEQCLALPDLPGALYSKKDRKQEEFFCSIDLYGKEIALCPKTWSTSPGMIVVTTADTGLTPTDYEAKFCGPKDGLDKLAKFKQTMNGDHTSGTFSPSSLLYYHFSRYFNTTVIVPVSVYRTMDKEMHFARVTSKAKGKGKMIAEGWRVLSEAEKNPSSYDPTNDIFTPDEKQIYGILLRDKGTRYGPEFNGTRARKGGEGQSLDFQETPAFLALRSEKPLEEAMAEGVRLAKNDPKVAESLGTIAPSNEQLALWMEELTEITLLDYIFSQQDRVGNIDYQWFWYYQEDGKLHAKHEKHKEGEHDLPRASMNQIRPPKSIAANRPILVQRTSIGDNDAGGRVQYTNYTKRTKMLEKLRHYNADTYRQLVHLNEDLKANGPIASWLRSSFKLSEEQLTQIVSNTDGATLILQGLCTEGKLRFDLDGMGYLAGQRKVETVNCLAP